MQVCNAKGVLFVPDIHIWPYRPGRRTDTDFAETMLGKLSEAVDIANAHDLVLVFTGDIFERPVLRDERTRGRIYRERRRSKFDWFINTGNHDKSEHRLCDRDTLKTMAETGLFVVADTTCVPLVVETANKRFAVGMTPYGEDIPDDVRADIPDGVNTVGWVTHHDLAFDGAYPNARELHGIAGCQFVINGHMHNRAPVRKAGGTMWFNPGAIVRQRLDESQQVPAVWAFYPDSGEFEKHVLSHASDPFDWTGYRVTADGRPEPISGQTETDPETGAKEQPGVSAFVNLMVREQETDLPRSHDGSVLDERISDYFERNTVAETTRSLVWGLKADVVENQETP